jgi:hypothetical protein
MFKGFQEDLRIQNVRYYLLESVGIHVQQECLITLSIDQLFSLYLISEGQAESILKQSVFTLQDRGQIYDYFLRHLGPQKNINFFIKKFITEDIPEEVHLPNLNFLESISLFKDYERQQSLFKLLCVDGSFWKSFNHLLEFFTLLGLHNILTIDLQSSTANQEYKNLLFREQYRQAFFQHGHTPNKF